MITDWNKEYEKDPEKMPWFLSELDPDLKQALKDLNIKEGTFFDLGTGPGTQAIALSELGFDVTAADISDNAVEKARKRAGDMNIHFVKNDILNPSIKDKFNYIFDRGVFHVFQPEYWEKYVNNVKNLLEDKGIHWTENRIIAG